MKSKRLFFLWSYFFLAINITEEVSGGKQGLERESTKKIDWNYKETPQEIQMQNKCMGDNCEKKGYFLLNCRNIPEHKKCKEKCLTSGGSYTKGGQCVYRLDGCQGRECNNRCIQKGYGGIYKSKKKECLVYENLIVCGHGYAEDPEDKNKCILINESRKKCLDRGGIFYSRSHKCQSPEWESRLKRKEEERREVKKEKDYCIKNLGKEGCRKKEYFECLFKEKEYEESLGICIKPEKKCNDKVEKERETCKEEERRKIRGLICAYSDEVLSEKEETCISEEDFCKGDEKCKKEKNQEIIKYQCELSNKVLDEKGKKCIKKEKESEEEKEAILKQRLEEYRELNNYNVKE